jgi:Ca2+-transporting ATPase
MALVGLSLMNIFLAFNLRFPEDSVFGRATLANPRFLEAIGWVLLASLLVTETHVLQNVFGTVSLTMGQWGVCLVPGVLLLAGGELLKLILRARRAREESASGVAAPLVAA